jgi:hypothetical protein
VSSQVEGDDVEPVREPLLRKLSEAPAMPRDAVQADDGRSVRIAPLMRVEAH